MESWRSCKRGSRQRSLKLIEAAGGAVAPDAPIPQRQKTVLSREHGIEAVARQVMLDLNASIRHTVHHRIEPIPAGQAVKARGLWSAVGDEGEIGGGVSGGGLGGGVCGDGGI